MGQAETENDDMKKGKLLLFGLAVLTLASVGYTWAAWSDQIQTGNEYMVPQYKTSLEEEFNPPDDWQPGITTQKDVWVSNNVTGEDGTTESAVPVIAKVEISQSWVRRESISIASGSDSVVVSEAGEVLPISFVSDDGTTEYAALLNFTDDVVVLRSGMAQDEGMRLGLTYVDSVEEAAGKWLLVDEDPSETGNYVLYYIGVLQPGENSPVFLTSVTMNPLLENTISSKDTYYEKTEDGYKQVTVTTVNSKYGYDSSRYTMDIKMTTVQATKAAVEQAFQGGFYEEVIYYLANVVADEGVYDASDIEKKLTIVRNGSRGELEYIPYRTGEGIEEGNWFMSFTDMVPGGIYKDSLQVENTAMTLNLYMSIVPREQDELLDELLELIYMTVSWNGEVIYEGTATGASYNGGTDLQNLLLLAKMVKGETGLIEVTLQLDPNMECDPVTGKCIYADLLTKIDWMFYIQGTSGSNGGGGGSGGSGSSSGSSTSGGPGVSGSGETASGSDAGSDIPLQLLPKTGDSTPLMILYLMTAVSGLLVVGLGAATYRTFQKAKKEH